MSGLLLAASDDVDEHVLRTRREYSEKECRERKDGRRIMMNLDPDMRADLNEAQIDASREYRLKKYGLSEIPTEVLRDELSRRGGGP